MELEEWIREDMCTFIKKHVPEEDKHDPVRTEDFRHMKKELDYQQRIEDALEKNRYLDAVRIFKELKKKFMEIPLNHQEERKKYFRLIQICYKMIYDYVAEQHKTSRIMDSLAYRADVFDTSEAPIDLSRIGSESMPVPPIEEAMLADKHPEYKEQPRVLQNLHEEIGKATHRLSKATSELVEAAKRLEEKKTQAHTHTKELPMLPELPKEQPIPVHVEIKQPVILPGKIYEQPIIKSTPPLPAWKPPKHDERLTPRIHYKNHTTKLKGLKKPSLPSFHAGFPKLPPQPKWTPPTKSEAPPSKKKSTVHELVKQAHKHLEQRQVSEAQQTLIDARHAINKQDASAEEILHVKSLEQQIGNALKNEPLTAADKEMFSSLYVKGIHAMAAGDYVKAIGLFRERIKHAPHDMAAQIRLGECLEAVNG